MIFSPPSTPVCGLAPMRRKVRGRSRAMNRAVAEVLEPRLLMTATPLYWDTASDAGLQGGDGTWSTTDTNWNTAADGSGTRVAWTNGDDAVFSDDVGGVVTISGGVTANSVTFNSSPYTISGSTLTLSGAATI